MLETMLTQTRLAYDNYWTCKRNDWILKWPEQIVLLVNSMTWTKEVSGKKDSVRTSITITFYNIVLILI